MVNNYPPGMSGKDIDRLEGFDVDPDDLCPHDEVREYCTDCQWEAEADAAEQRRDAMEDR